MFQPFRQVIGSNPKIWSDYVDVFRLAIPSLEQRTFGDPALCDGPSSNAIVANYVSLHKDLQRLENALALARNVLSCGSKVQNLAAQVGFDSEVCVLINLCVKITARGYDGDGPPAEEDSWNNVVASFKRVLIVSLQFLNNLVTLNERLKLMLWVELFDSGGSEGGMVDSIQGVLQAERDTQGWSGHAPNAFYSRAKAPQAPGQFIKATKDPLKWPDYRPFKPVTPFFFWLTYCASKIEEEIFLEKHPARVDTEYELDAHLTRVELVEEGLARWRVLDIGDRDQIAEKWDDIQLEPRFSEHVHYIEAWKEANWPEDFDDDVGAQWIVDCYVYATAHAEGREVSNETGEVDNAAAEVETAPGREEINKVGSNREEPDRLMDKDIFAPPTTNEPDYRMMVSALDGMQKLDEGKRQLLKRLDIGEKPPVPERDPAMDQIVEMRQTLQSDPNDTVEIATSKNNLRRIMLEYHSSDYDTEDKTGPQTEEQLQAYGERMEARAAAAAENYQRLKAEVAAGTPAGKSLEAAMIADDNARSARRAMREAEREREEEGDDEDEEDSVDGNGDVLDYGPEGDEDEEDEEDDGEEGEDEDDEDEEEDEDEEDENEEYAPGEDGRGLLTDVPLILGPNEIVVLPMLIMSGIVPPTESPHEKKDDYALINMYTIRCHLLLAQENGRNLLRELLIFVAAWDLREEELYFKFMVKIMEAILVNGLMPFAYGAFKE